AECFDDERRDVVRSAGRKCGLDKPIDRFADIPVRHPGPDLRFRDNSCEPVRAEQESVAGVHAVPINVEEQSLLATDGTRNGGGGTAFRLGEAVIASQLLEPTFPAAVRPAIACP